MRLTGDAVDAGSLAFRVLFFHVDLKSFLVLVMPIALGTLESLAGVSAVDTRKRTTWTCKPAARQDKLALGTLDTTGPALHVLRTHTDCRTS